MTFTLQEQNNMLVADEVHSIGTKLEALLWLKP